MFDLTDLLEAPAVETAIPKAEEPTELQQWAQEQVEKNTPKQPNRPFNGVCYDIETGARPLDEIECFYNAPVYVEPAKLPPFDDSMVKYGNAKREEKRAEIRQEFIAKYQERLATEAQALVDHKAEFEFEAANHKATWLEKAALSPITGRCLLIGIRVGDGKIFLDNADEAEMLGTFWSSVEDWLDRKLPIIGHNSNGFDLPFVVRRSWQLGVPVPREVRQGCYWNPLFMDTMEVWNCGARDFVKLNLLGQFFGVGQKTEGVAGKDFSKLWFGTMDPATWGTPEQQRAKAIEYNGQDLDLTAAVAVKMNMV